MRVIADRVSLDQVVDCIQEVSQGLGQIPRSFRLEIADSHAATFLPASILVAACQNADQLTLAVDSLEEHADENALIENLRENPASMLQIVPKADVANPCLNVSSKRCRILLAPWRFCGRTR